MYSSFHSTFFLTFNERCGKMWDDRDPVQVTVIIRFSEGEIKLCYNFQRDYSGYSESNGNKFTKIKNNKTRTDALHPGFHFSHVTTLVFIVLNRCDCCPHSKCQYVLLVLFHLIWCTVISESFHHKF